MTIDEKKEYYKAKGWCGEPITMVFVSPSHTKEEVVLCSSAASSCKEHRGLTPETKAANIEA